MNVLGMKYLQSLAGMSRMDRVRNEEVRRRGGIERELARRVNQRLLTWFGHLERMDEYRMARIVLMAEASGGRVPGRPRLWMDGVKVPVGRTGMTVEQCANVRKEWRTLVHIYRRLSFTLTFLVGSCVLSDHPPEIFWLITWGEVG